MPKKLPAPLKKQREVLYMPEKGHVAILGTAGKGIADIVEPTSPRADGHRSPPLENAEIKNIRSRSQSIRPGISHQPRVLRSSLKTGPKKSGSVQGLLEKQPAFIETLRSGMKAQGSFMGPTIPPRGLSSIW
jgi:hypothetical protein